MSDPTHRGPPAHDLRTVFARACHLVDVQAMLINKTFASGDLAYFDYGCQLAQRSEADALYSLAGLRRAD